MPTTVYTLELKHRRYFVGHTRHLDRRYASHEAGEEGRWTARYKPRRVIRAKQLSSIHANFHENYYVARLMLKHGIQYVRGGRMQKPDRFDCDDRDDLVDFLVEFLDITPKAATDVVDEQILACGRPRCRFCGREELSESDADASDAHASDDDASDDDTSSASSDDGAVVWTFRRGCRRCGMHDHHQDDCDEVRDVDGNWLRGCPRCGRMHRENDCCYNRDACGRRLR